MGIVREFAAKAIDARLALREGERGIAQRAVERQLAMVAWARSGSPYYRRLYRGLPADITTLQDVPPVTKPALMAEFDDWVTDGAVLREDLRTWLADPATIGRMFRGKYLAYTTSGTTGEPAVLLEDEASLAAAYASRARMVPGFLSGELIREYLRRRGAVATLLAQWGLIPLLRLGPRASALWGISVAAAGAAVIMLARTEHSIMMGMGIASLGFGLFRPGFTAGASLAVSRAEQGQSAGIVASVNGAAYIFAPAIGVWLYGHSPWVGFAAIELLCLAVIVLGLKSMGKDEDLTRPNPA